MSAINRFLLENKLRIATNPCVSPDFCLDWSALRDELRAGKAMKGTVAPSAKSWAVAAT